jgi:hypothetical protein
VTLAQERINELLYVPKKVAHKKILHFYVTKQYNGQSIMMKWVRIDPRRSNVHEKYSQNLAISKEES